MVTERRPNSDEGDVLLPKFSAYYHVDYAPEKVFKSQDDGILGFVLVHGSPFHPRSCENLAVSF